MNATTPCAFHFVVLHCAVYVCDSTRGSSDATIKYSSRGIYLQGCGGTFVDMKSDVVMLEIMLIWDFIFMFLCLDMVLYIWGYL